MTTPLALAQVLHQQAVADLAEAQTELHAAMQAAEPGTSDGVDAMENRKWVSRIEGRRPLWELSQAHSAWRRCQLLERRARSAAYKASLAPPLSVTPAKRTRKKQPRKMTFAAYLEARAA